MFVMPAKVGISGVLAIRPETPAFAGVTNDISLLYLKHIQGGGPLKTAARLWLRCGQRPKCTPTRPVVVPLAVELATPPETYTFSATRPVSAPEKPCSP